MLLFVCFFIFSGVQQWLSKHHIGDVVSMHLYVAAILSMVHFTITELNVLDVQTHGSLCRSHRNPSFTYKLHHADLNRFHNCESVDERLAAPNPRFLYTYYYLAGKTHRIFPNQENGDIFHFCTVLRDLVLSVVSVIIK